MCLIHVWYRQQFLPTRVVVWVRRHCFPATSQCCGHSRHLSSCIVLCFILFLGFFPAGALSPSPSSHLVHCHVAPAPSHTSTLWSVDSSRSSRRTVSYKFLQAGHPNHQAHTGLMLADTKAITNLLCEQMCVSRQRQGQRQRQRQRQGERETVTSSQKHIAAAPVEGHTR